MTRKRLFLIALIVASAALGIHQALTQYNGNLVRGVGYSLAPWLFGSVVAVIKELYLRLRRRPHDFVNSMAWAACVMIVLLSASAVMRGW